ncbi:sugar phosphate isomerase family protein (plasmid) [Rhizobium gallicum bv. gallicum R602sp]|uniref:Sugar phosphate isomerase family protein n=1 Tax=Rhizobium gallicum bv. gallicum R602sp TaxID=1041138 RepID=A0A0B4X9P2_9HYPH|nr:sugar phosphate isomerase family protein [Rhizobium gallicum bv. gallicum R602sp]
MTLSRRRDVHCRGWVRPLWYSYASCSSNSIRRGCWQSACGWAAPALPASMPRPASGTVVANGKRLKIFDGEVYMFATGIVADLSIVNEAAPREAQSDQRRLALTP